MYEYYNDGRQPIPPSGPSFGPPFGQPLGQPDGPPFGPPFGQPGRPPFGPPAVDSQETTSGPPSGPPPAFTPSQAQAQTMGVGVYAVDPGAVRPCRFRYVYIWTTSGDRFWAWLVFVGRRSVSGWRWTGFRWIYFGMDLRNIESFVCY